MKEYSTDKELLTYNISLQVKKFDAHHPTFSEKNNRL